MKVQAKSINFEDERGYIQDILTNESVEHATYIFTKKGVVRGNHYHKETVQFTYVLEGKIEYHFVTEQGEQGVVEMGAGDLTRTPANERHAIKTLEDTKMMIFTCGVRGGCDYEKDTYRLEEPIVK